MKYRIPFCRRKRRPTCVLFLITVSISLPAVVFFLTKIVGAKWNDCSESFAIGCKEGEEFLSTRISRLRHEIRKTKDEIGLYVDHYRFLQKQKGDSKARDLGPRKLMKFESTGRTLLPISLERMVLPSSENLINETLLTCREIQTVTNGEIIGAGNTKQVEKGKIGGKVLALKKAYISSQDFKECESLYGMSPRDCIKLSNYKLLKEIILLNELRHANIVKLLGYCLQRCEMEEGCEEKLTVATELGEPLNFLMLLQRNWEDRFRICLGLAKILYKLSTSSLGSLAIHDFKLSQFVIKGGEIQLADLDDLDNNEVDCRLLVDCNLEYATSTNISTPCQQGKCTGRNEKMNILKAHYQFFSYLLPFEAPQALKPRIDKLLNTAGSGKLSAEKVLSNMMEIFEFYQTGDYLQEGNQENIGGVYMELHESDLTEGRGDYPCTGSMSTNSCILTAFDLSEAQDMCNRDIDCKAFVVTSQKTWTGRTVIYLKNTAYSPVSNMKTILYIKQ